MSISKEQWKAIEDELTSFIGRATFSVMENGEALEIFVTRTRISEGEYQLVVCIGEEIKFSWGHPTSTNYRPLVEKVWRRRSRSVYSPSRAKRIEKAFGKRAAKKQFPNLHEKAVWREPIFPKAKTLVSQFKKIEGLKLLDLGHKSMEAV